MEACVLIPTEFNLVLTPHPEAAPGRFFEMGVSIWTTKTLLPGRTFYPNQGVIKLDKLEVYGQLLENDVRNKFGCIDEIKTSQNGKVRHCNWVRFLQPSSNFNKVNIVGVKVNGLPVFQIVKMVTPNTQLLVYFDEKENGTVPIKMDKVAATTDEKEKSEVTSGADPHAKSGELSAASEDLDSDDDPIDVVDGDCIPFPLAKESPSTPVDKIVVAEDKRIVETDKGFVSEDNREGDERCASPPPSRRSPKKVPAHEFVAYENAAANQFAGFYSAPNKNMAAYFTSMLMAQEAARIEWHHRQQECISMSPGSQREGSPETGFDISPPNAYRIIPNLCNPYITTHSPAQKRGTLSPQASRSMLSPKYCLKDNQFAMPSTMQKHSSPMMPFLPTPWGVSSPDLTMRQTVISPISYGYPSPNKMISPLSTAARSLKMPAEQVAVDEEMKSLPSEGAGSSEESHNTSKSSTVSGKSSASSSPRKSPVKRNRERTWLPCEVCNKKFDRPSLLRRHMRTHTGEKPHVCDVCGKAFSTSSSLNTHRRIHSGEKPHQCRVCGKRFTASSNLYYHRMTHNKEKPHKCSLCSKSFPTPGDLKSHMYVHNGSWPYRCNICDRGFSKQTNLKNHLLLHSGDKPHECQLCGKRFALQCNLRTHQKTHENEPQEECFKCGKMFLTQMQLLNNGYCKTCMKSLGGATAGPECEAKRQKKQDVPKPFKSITEFLKPDEKKRTDNRPLGVFRYPFLGPPMDMAAYSGALFRSTGIPGITPPDVPLPVASNLPHLPSFASYMSAMPSMINFPGESYPQRPIGTRAKLLQRIVQPGNVHPGTSWPNIVANTVQSDY